MAAATAPLRRQRSQAQRCVLASAVTCSRWARSAPACSQAGAWGRSGGLINATQRPARVRRAMVGSSNDSAPSPRAGRFERCAAAAPGSGISSIEAAVGQPPPGSSASSSAKPLGWVAVGPWASCAPRQRSERCSSTSSDEAGTTVVRVDSVLSAAGRSGDSGGGIDPSSLRAGELMAVLHRAREAGWLPLRSVRSAWWTIRRVVSTGDSASQRAVISRTQSACDLEASLSQLATESCT